MRRVLVPLDGSAFAESIIPDARRLAGVDGELTLVRDASVHAYDSDHKATANSATIPESDEYLDNLAHQLRGQGVHVQAETTFLSDVAVAIDDMAKYFDVDIIACATHGRSPMGRLIRGGVAWRAVAGSRVPVLLRHIEATPEQEAASPSVRRILVPLDGSEYAEKALPLATELALEWNAEIVLVRVVAVLPARFAPYGPYEGYAIDYRADAREAQTYLDGVASGLPIRVRTHTFTGPIEDQLIKTVAEEAITDIVMTSHGRTGLSRAILGSVADDLIHTLRLPIIVIPAMATGVTIQRGLKPETAMVPVSV